MLSLFWTTSPVFTDFELNLPVYTQGILPLRRSLTNEVLLFCEFFSCQRKWLWPFGINMRQSITTISAALWSLATRVVLNSSNTKISIGDENSPWHHNYPFLTFILLKPSCNELYQEKLQKSNSTLEFCQKKQGCLTIIVAVKVKEEFFRQSSYRKNMVNYIDNYIHSHITWCITVHPKDLSASPPCLWLCQLEL